MKARSLEGRIAEGMERLKENFEQSKNKGLEELSKIVREIVREELKSHPRQASVRRRSGGR